MLAAFAPRSWANTLRNSDSGSGLLLLLLEPELLPSQCGSDADGSGLLVQWWWGCSWGVAPLLCVFLTDVLVGSGFCKGLDTDGVLRRVGFGQNTWIWVKIYIESIR